jgi:hypothetical protein
MTQNWGPFCIVPSAGNRGCSGVVTLRESLDEDLLRQELISLELPADLARISNPWYYRPKSSDSWIKIGESDDEENSFAVEWDTSRLPNGRYEVMGLMHVLCREGTDERLLARQSVVEVLVKN